LQKNVSKRRYFLDRLSPVTRLAYRIRNLERSSILDGSYFCDGAVGRLVLEWKFQRERWIDESDGKEIESLEVSEPDFNELLRDNRKSNKVSSILQDTT
jgi:hypothetical protein